MTAPPATRTSEEDIDEENIKEVKSALRAMWDYTVEHKNDNVFARFVIEEPAEFRGKYVRLIRIHKQVSVNR